MHARLKSVTYGPSQEFGIALHYSQTSCWSVPLKVVHWVYRRVVSIVLGCATTAHPCKGFLALEYVEILGLLDYSAQRAGQGLNKCSPPCH